MFIFIHWVPSTDESLLVHGVMLETISQVFILMKTWLRHGHLLAYVQNFYKKNINLFCENIHVDEINSLFSF